MKIIPSEILFGFVVFDCHTSTQVQFQLYKKCIDTQHCFYKTHWGLIHHLPKKHFSQFGQ
jgi:hypothetical protein